MDEIREEDYPLDFGSGFRGRWVGWHPDREINPQYEGIPDLEKAVLMLKCPHGVGGVSVHPSTHDAIFKEAGWTVHSWDPLTLTPSISREECGCHGYIIDGKWRDA